MSIFCAPILKVLSIGVWHILYAFEGFGLFQAKGGDIMASYTGKTITTRTKFTSDTYDKCTFTVTSSGYGGALYNSDSGTASLTITGSEFKNCSAYAGSAIYFSGTGIKTVSIADTTFTNCTDSATSWAGTVTNDNITVADVTVKNPVELTPIRTFREIEQPESPFVLRFDENGNCALFTGDGAAWRLLAVARIAEYLKNNLTGYNVVVIG